ncbi:hypothetical protein LG201_09550 [Methylobacillus gramineus]|uniref:hypothetical protein n=1 Tax=Methylobacillus gramineus TaxID=755169 RepID=UPI001CFFCABA|nr:hypothetical protein [Methylobacillus gramineus]MCB5185444.1 hypothetical protein [Methylobacillus gramineus]
MFERIILCASHDRLTAGRWSFGRLRNYELFNNDAQGQQAFAHFLQRYAYAPIYLLADAQEEDFHLETLPHTTGKARQEMLQRKLNQVYRGADFRTAQFVNRERDKRKDDRFLFVALTNGDFLQPWLEVIGAQQAPLAGIYSLSMLSQVFLRKMNITAPNILLSEHLASGLRQSFLHEGKLRISRLVHIPPEAYEQFAYFHLVETDKARLYLLSQRLIARDTALQVVLLTIDENAEQICRNIEQEQGLKCQAVKLTEVARRYGLPSHLIEHVPELLHMHLLARGNRPDNLAPDPLIKTYKLELLRKSMMAVALLIALLGLLLTIFYLHQSIGEAHEIQQAMAITSEQEQRYNEVANDFPVTPLPGMDLQVAAEVRDAIQRQEGSPQHMMHVLSRTLESMPNIQLNRLRWVLSNDLAIKDEEGSATQPVTVANATVFTPQQNVLYQVGFVSGEIRGFTGNYRAALDTVHRLAEMLKANNAVADVVILQQPVNVSSYTSLQGSTTDERTAQRQAAIFKIKLVLKPEVPA